MKELTGLDLIKEYRENPGKYLPMTDHRGQVPGRNEYGEINIGWNAGLLEKNRPYFVECWAADQSTYITIFVSTKGIENKSPEEMEQWFQDIGYFRYRGDKHYAAEVRRFGHPDGNEFFSINIVVGEEDEPALIDGAPIKPWSILNEYNLTQISR
jgi:hypothetical protein